MRFDAVLFDLFGTLIEFLPDELYDENGYRMADALGVPPMEFREAWLSTNVERNEGRFGSLAGDVRAVCRLLGHEPTPEQVEEAVEIRFDIIRRNHEPRVGAIETIEALKSIGLKVALVSDAAYDTPEIWHESDFAPLLDAVAFSCCVGVCKPDPAMYEHAYRAIGVSSDRCLYVGDGGSMELTSARKLGMTPVLIRDGYESVFVRRPDARNWDGLAIEHLGEVLRIVEPAP